MSINVPEMWADVLGWQGIYKVSNLGNFESLPRMAKTGNGYRRVKGRMFKGCEKMLYPMVVLSMPGRRLFGYTHILVWEAFNGPIPEKMEVNHKDGNQHNSRLDNLELVTKSGQQIHALRIGLRKTKYPLDKVLQIKEDCKTIERYPSGRVVHGEWDRLAKKHSVSWGFVVRVGKNKMYGWLNNDN